MGDEAEQIEGFAGTLSRDGLTHLDHLVYTLRYCRIRVSAREFRPLARQLASRIRRLLKRIEIELPRAEVLAWMRRLAALHVLPEHAGDRRLVGGGASTHEPQVVTAPVRYPPRHLATLVLDERTRPRILS